MDSDEHDLEVLRQALRDEKALGLTPEEDVNADGITPTPRPDHLPRVAQTDGHIDLDESTDALREALAKEKNKDTSQ